MFLVAMLILLILWGCQVLFINSFYMSVKIDELKKASNEVLDNLETDGSEEMFDRIIMQNDINIRIINTSDFENLYSGGDGFISATHDIGFFEIMKLYDLAVKNGGEISQYYTYDREKEHQHYSKRIEEDAEKNGDSSDENGEENGGNNLRSGPEIGVQFFSAKPPAMFVHSDKYVNDFLYAKIAEMSDGTEVMIISDVQVTPLDSTVKILKFQLIATSCIALAFTLVLSYIISRYISRPIEQLNASAKELARGKYDTKFSGKGYREIEQLSDTLNFTASELGKVDQFRTELLANVSHDLRTPLTMIEGYAEVMRDIPGENTPENIQVIIDETNRLTEFVNNILNLSKLRSGIEKYEFEDVNITEMLEEICARYTNLTKAEGYSVNFSFNKEAHINCDRKKITQALYNLMDNAVNHTGEDKLVYVKQKAADGVVRIEISDTGTGINPDELPYIWDRYYRANTNHKRAVVGSGIGLSIVKSVFEKHKIQYGVESEYGTGTTFWAEFKEIETNDKNERK